MEHLIDAVRAIARCRAAEARLALFLVLDVLKTVLPDEERAELVERLPTALGFLLLGEATDDDEVGVREELALVNARTVDVVCRVLATDASPRLEHLLLRYVAHRLGREAYGARLAMDSVGIDGLATPQPTVRAPAQAHA